MIVDELASPAKQNELPDASSRPTRFIARQPILDTRRNIIGYELLFRSGWENSFNGDTNKATHIMLDNCLIMRMENLAQQQLAFVNCTRESLVKQHVALLPPATTVLEVLETVEPDKELVAACLELAKMGYKFALDDFAPREEWQPLINLADYLKVDFRLSDAAERKKIHRMVRGTRVELLAEKIETEEEFNIALSEGYRYFQGYFFCRPTIIAEHEISPNRQNYLRLLLELSKDPLNISTISHIVESEPSLCYRLLRLANSASMGMRSAITSVTRAMMVVGEARFRTLVSVAAASAMGHNQPQALINLTLERARFCELLSPMIGENPTEQYMLGLLSLIDAILQMPMEKIVELLPLRKEIKESLVGVDNPVALPLKLIKNYELGDWGPCLSAANELGITEETLTSVYLEAIHWVAEALEAS